MTNNNMKWLFAFYDDVVEKQIVRLISGTNNSQLSEIKFSMLSM
jgi:hypothetical protein